MDAFLLILLTCTVVHGATVFECSFNTDFCNMEQSTNDTAGDWVRGNSTPSSNTGPSADYSGQGQFIFLEASNQTSGSYVDIRTPIQTGSSVYCVRFYYNLYGQHIGSLEVRASATNNVLWIGYRNTANASGVDVWLYREINFTNSEGQIIFRAITGGNVDQPFGDIAIDDVSILNTQCDGTGGPEPTTTTSTTSTSTTTTPSTTTSTTTTPSTTTTTTPSTTTSSSTSTTPSTTTTTTSTTSTSTTPSTTTTTTSTTTTTEPEDTTASNSRSTQSNTTASSMATGATASTMAPSTTMKSSKKEEDVSFTEEELWRLKGKYWIIILVVGGALLLLMLIIICCVVCKYNRSKQSSHDMNDGFDPSFDPVPQPNGKPTGQTRPAGYINAYENGAYQAH